MLLLMEEVVFYTVKNVPLVSIQHGYSDSRTPWLLWMEDDLTFMSVVQGCFSLCHQLWFVIIVADLPFTISFIDLLDVRLCFQHLQSGMVGRTSPTCGMLPRLFHCQEADYCLFEKEQREVSQSSSSSPLCASFCGSNSLWFERQGFLSLEYFLSPLASSPCQS